MRARVREPQSVARVRPPVAGGGVCRGRAEAPRQGVNVDYPLRLFVIATIVACSSADRDTADTASAAVDSMPHSSTAPDTTPRQWIVRADGIGPLQVGVPLAAASRTLGEELRVDEPGCDHVNPSAMPDGVLLMVIDDTVARVEVDSAGIRTGEGAQVGDSESRV